MYYCGNMPKKYIPKIGSWNELKLFFPIGWNGEPETSDNVTAFLNPSSFKYIKRKGVFRVRSGNSESQSFEIVSSKVNRKVIKKLS